MICRHRGRPEAYQDDSLSDDGLSRFRAVRGDPAWQAEWELLAILISLHVFHSKLVEARAQSVVQCDSLAASDIAYIWMSSSLSSSLLSISKVC